MKYIVYISFCVNLIKSHQVVMNDGTDPNTAVNYLNSPISTDIYRIICN